MANSFSVPATSSTGATTQSLVKGDNPVPFAAAILGGSTADTLTTGDLSAGDDLDFGNLSSFTIEFWFQCSALPASNIEIARGPTSFGANGWQWAIRLNTGGDFTVYSFDETNTQRSLPNIGQIYAGQTYHIVYTCQAGGLWFYINSVLVGSGSFAGHTLKTLLGTAGLSDVAIFGPASANFFFDEFAMYRTGLTATRVLKHYEAGTIRGYDVQYPGERIGAVLDTVNNHAPRSIQLGTRPVIPRYMTGQSPLDEARRAAEAEDVDAALFVQADGTVTFLADGHRSSSPYNTSQVTVGDAGGAEIPYVDLKEADYSDDGVTNEWNVTRAPFRVFTPVTQTRRYQVSIDDRGIYSESLTDVPCCTDTDAGNIADGLLAKTRSPIPRIESITFDCTDPETAAAVFRRELMDKITVKRTPPGGGSRISQDLWIQHISVSGANDGHAPMVTWTVSPV